MKRSAFGRTVATPSAVTAPDRHFSLGSRRYLAVALDMEPDDKHLGAALADQIRIWWRRTPGQWLEARAMAAASPSSAAPSITPMTRVDGELKLLGQPRGQRLGFGISQARFVHPRF
ncbi:MAG: hypothetical protein EON54_18145 [Alcaligenaceae bacterium]|nr:MAG: hypothetical protein EON54_18145 [Alcaligenaceae bacterium]